MRGKGQENSRGGVAWGCYAGELKGYEEMREAIAWKRREL